MGHDDLVIIGRVPGALAIGAMIGFERTFHGRPAGFRTHALVCIASAVLMIVTVYQNQWMTEVAHEAIRTDPTRMAQGIMTGIGFLGGRNLQRGLNSTRIDDRRLDMGNSCYWHPDRNWLLVRGPCRRGGHADRAGGISVYRGETAERVLRPPHAAVPARSRDG